MKLIKLKLQDPSLSRVPSKALRGPLVMCSHGHIFLKNLQRYFNHIRLSIIDVCQAIDRDDMIFFLILWFVCYLSAV
jgi:hypothetical protein